MKKSTFKLAVIMAAAVSVAAFAEEASPKGDAPKNAGPRSVHEIIHRETGGRLRTLYPRTKSVYYVNAQKRVGAKVVEEAREKMEQVLRTPIGSTNGVFALQSPRIYGALSLYVIDDESLPMSLVAPEGRWAFVNVAPLAQGRGEKPAFLEARVKKEMARIGCLILGGISSTYRENLLGFVGSPEGLDKFTDDTLPVDGPLRCGRYLLSLGVKPYRDVTYKKACQEGWAPQPTNDVQKAIWEDVHKIPENPIKIEFDPKKGR